MFNSNLPYKAIIAARKHLGGEMESSARLCLCDAIEAYDAGNLDAALLRSVDSLKYSVGILHKDYQSIFNAAIREGIKPQV